MMLESDLPALAKRLGGDGTATGTPAIYHCNCPAPRHLYKIPNGKLDLSWGPEGLRVSCHDGCTIVAIEKAIRAEFLTPAKKLTKKQIEEQAAIYEARKALWTSHDWTKPLIDDDLMIVVREERWYNGKEHVFGWHGWLENIKTHNFIETNYPYETRNALLNQISDNLLVWRRRVQLPDRKPKTKPKPESATPVGPKWIKAAKTDNKYIKIPLGTMTVFAAGTVWGISWFAKGGKSPFYAPTNYATREEAISAMGYSRQRISNTLARHTGGADSGLDMLVNRSVIWLAAVRWRTVAGACVAQSTACSVGLTYY